MEGRSAADANVPPYSGAVLIGDTLHLAGAIGLDENLEVPDDPADEARNVMNAIKRNVEAAGKVGDLIALRAKEVGVERVAFDRSGYKYHGRVKALAMAAREGGLEF